jgi:hypothetical protein
VGAYAYKYTRDLLPPYITDRDGYDGDANYDGDMWYATQDYIEELEMELSLQYQKTQDFANQPLKKWLTERPKTFYCSGPAIHEPPDDISEQQTM